MHRYYIQYLLDGRVTVAFWITAPSAPKAMYEAEYEFEARTAAEPEMIPEDWDSITVTNEVAYHQMADKKEVANAD